MNWHSKLALIIIWFSNQAFGQASIHETEPNDDAANFNRIAGPTRVIGTLPTGDQDGFLWTVSDVDAARPWTFTLQGVPGALTVAEVIRLERADDGKTLTGRKVLFRLGTRDGSRPGVAEEVLFEPGEYLLGLARAGGSSAFRPPAASASFDALANASTTATEPQQTQPAHDSDGYRLNIEAGKPFAQGSQSTRHHDRKGAIALRPNNNASAYATHTQSWFRFALNPAQSETRWDLSAQVPVGRTAKLTLLNQQDIVLAEARSDQKGKMDLPDLSLETGSYQLRIEGEADVLQALRLTAAGTRIADSEAEPNDQWALANRVDLEGGAVLSGQFQRPGDADHFRFEVGEATADKRLALEIGAPPGEPYEICLLDHRGASMQCRSGEGDRQLDGLVLTPGTYGVRVARGKQGSAYTLRLSDDGDHDPTLESEPNDTAALATTVASNLRMKGTLEKGDVDFIRFDLGGEAQLWRFQVNGEGVHEVAHHDGSGGRTQVIRAASGQRRVILDNLYLLPGTHYIAISGQSAGNYTLLARALGQPDPNGELEPNDDVTRMQPIRIDQTRSGTLPDAADRDNYRFHLAGRDHVRLRIEPPPDGSIHATLDWDGDRMGEAVGAAPGEALTLDALLPPGDYRLELRARQPSDAEYRVTLTRLPRYSCATDCEPNNNASFASPVPPDGMLQGQAGDWRDDDWYVLSARDVDTRWELEGNGPGIALLAAPEGRDELSLDRSNNTRSAMVPAGATRYLRIRGKGEYAYQLRTPDQVSVPSDLTQAPAPSASHALSISLDLPLADVAAYLPMGQRLDGRLRVLNRSSQIVEFGLEAATSDSRWSVILERDRIELAPDGSAELGLRVRVPDDAWADRPVRVSVGAHDMRGQLLAQTHAEINIGRDSTVAHPAQHWALPATLLGGFNLAWDALGAVPRSADDPRAIRNLEKLFDGMAVRDEGLIASAPAADEDGIIVELAAGGGEVAGFIFNPLGRGSAKDYPRRFEVALSNDGQSFDIVLTGKLEPVPQQQAFVLPASRQARYARLRLIDNFTGNPRTGRALGEWKVVARPGTYPFANTALNLADPSLGGHVVRARPQISSRWDDALLKADSADAHLRIRAGEVAEWVIGFHHNRAAMITRLEWDDARAAGKHTPIDRMRIMVSNESPLGPWTQVSDWNLAVGQPRGLTLDTPIWARFVRFATLPFEAASQVVAPAQVRIFERPAGPDYLSILGEWGGSDARASFEATHPPHTPPDFVPTRNDRRERADALSAGDEVAGRVLLGRHEHWYRIQLPNTQNTITIDLSGEPTLRTVIALSDANGDPIETRLIEQHPTRQRIEAFVGAGNDAFIQITEPPRNVVFAWDTSASVGAFLPIIYNSMSAYARDLVPGRDAANLMPFGSGLLMDDWHGEPPIMQKILNEYPRKESSSAAETTLARATRALAQRPGTKAIVLITDAATNRHPPVWEAFEAVRPRIMALGLDSHGAFGRYPPREQDLMQDWASVSGGHYAHLRSEGEMEIAFDRAATRLREPAAYRLRIAASHKEAPAPGSLRVISDGGFIGEPDQSGAIAIILDASGSMLQRLDGVRRIETARHGLIEVLTRHIAPGTPMALRVFGHRQPNACRTDLEIPLGPLKPEAAKRVIQGIEARNLARTPIADSLARAEADLSKAKGRKTIVLVSDGEETCDGDPRAVIEKLIEKGFDFRLNIIGFALDDDALAEQFGEWAALGGGQYFNASDAASFDKALASALQQAYSVFDRDGNELARGQVNGEALTVPAGTYRVQVANGVTFESVTVSTGGSQEIRIEKGARTP